MPLFDLQFMNNKHVTVKVRFVRVFLPFINAFVWYGTCHCLSVVFNIDLCILTASYALPFKHRHITVFKLSFLDFRARAKVYCLQTHRLVCSCLHKHVIAMLSFKQIQGLKIQVTGCETTFCFVVHVDLNFIFVQLNA